MNKNKMDSLNLAPYQIGMKKNQMFINSLIVVSFSTKKGDKIQNFTFMKIDKY